MPERAPLNPEVMGKLVAKGCTIEKVIFQSHKNFHVTANLYLPNGTGKKPGILLQCGHLEPAKAADAYQKASLLLAQHGFVVLCIDPIGQGERFQQLDEQDQPVNTAVQEHLHAGVAPVLLGQSLASYMLWDAMRGLDYLESRPEVDSDRLGCTGTSGGGNLTSYLMAYDDRVAAAAPSSFITTLCRKNRELGPGDSEQNLFAQIRDGFDHADFLITRAPKPTLILAARRDNVPIEGARETYQQAKRIYGILGQPNQVELLDADVEHGFTQAHREAAVKFFARWLQERDVEVAEDENLAVSSEEELNCTPNGQVLKMPEARSVHDLFQEKEARLATRRPKLNSDVVRLVTGIRTLIDLPAPQVERLSGNRLILHPVPGIQLSAQMLPGGELEPILLLDGRGMTKSKAKAEELHAQGHPVLAVDLRDIGETKTKAARYPGADAWIAYMLGESYLAMRAEDTLVCARFFSKETGSKTVAVHAMGELGPPALHAAALEPELFSLIEVRNSLASWREVMSLHEARWQLPNAAHGVLKYYDLPDLLRLIPPQKIGKQLQVGNGENG